MLSVEYLAGFVDGEGYLGLGRIPRGRSHEYCLRISVHNTNRQILEEIREGWGGCLAGAGAGKPGWKPAYVLIWTNAAAAGLLTEVAPYLRVKSKQAAQMQKFLHHLRRCRRARDRRGRLLPLSNSEVEVRETFHARLKELNRRGPGPVTPGPLPSGSGKSAARHLSPEYLAGFTDAEGCLMITKSEDRVHGRPQYRARISVANTNRATLEDVQRAYGGIIANQPPPRAGWKHAYQLVWTDGMVEALLSAVGLHLRLKRKQAAVILELIRHKRRTRQGRVGRFFAPLSSQVVAFREALYLRMRKLNAKGASSLIGEVDGSLLRSKTPRA